MCNCSKSITKSECDILRKYAFDVEGRFFIYHVFDAPRGLEIAEVKKGELPNRRALDLGFVTPEGVPEWYNVKEHPCLYEK